MIRRATVTAVVLATAACATDTGVQTTPTYVQAARVQLPEDLPPPAPPPVRQPRLHGAEAVHQAQRSVVVNPSDVEMDGTTWRIHGANAAKIYAIPVAPLEATTLLFPAQEGLAHAAIGAGPVDDFQITTAASGSRAAAFIMPNCASPRTERFAMDTQTPIRTCYTGNARATFLTTEGPIHVRFDVYDWTSVAAVEFNRALPPPTNISGTRGRPPLPRGPADPLYVFAPDGTVPPWKPMQAWADPTKLVIQFDAPLPTLPGLYAGGLGEQQVNYSVRELDDAVYIITDRRVTEAELRIDDEVVRISASIPRYRPRPRRPNGSS